MTAPNRPGACGSMRGRSKAMRRVPSANASLRSWVTMITVMPQSRQSGLISACICARVPGSSAPNGSSSSSTRGLRAIAWAIARRCCMPPESVLGYLSRCGVEPDLLDQAFALLDRRPARRAGQAREIAAAGELEGDQHVAQHGEMREHRIALEHDAAVRPRLVRHRHAIEQQRPARRPLLSEHHAQERALAAARRTDDRDEGAGRDLDIDPLQHDLVAVFDPHVPHRDRTHRRPRYLYAQGYAARDSQASA